MHYLSSYLNFCSRNCPSILVIRWNISGCWLFKILLYLLEHLFDAFNDTLTHKFKWNANRRTYRMGINSARFHLLFDLFCAEDPCDLLPSIHRHLLELHSPGTSNWLDYLWTDKNSMLRRLTIQHDGGHLYFL